MILHILEIISRYDFENVLVERANIESYVTHNTVFPNVRKISTYWVFVVLIQQWKISWLVKLIVHISLSNL